MSKRKRRLPRDLAALLKLDPAERRCVEDAAEDTHMTPADYCRVMVLAAAGMGGINDHLDRVIDASIRAEDENGWKAQLARQGR